MSKNKTLAIIFCSIFYLSINAQNIEETQEIAKAHFGISINPKVGFNSSQVDTNFESPKKLNFQIGGFYTDKIYKGVDFRIGINFKYSSFSLVDYSPIFPSDIDPNTGANPTKSWKEDSSKAFTVGIPVQVLFPILKQKKLYTIVGYEYEQEISGNYNSTFFICGNESSTITAINFLNKSRHLLRLGIGSKIISNKKYEILIEPMYERYLSSLSDSSIYNFNTEYVGLNVIVEIF